MKCLTVERRKELHSILIKLLDGSSGKEVLSVLHDINNTNLSDIEKLWITYCYGQITQTEYIKMCIYLPYYEKDAIIKRGCERNAVTRSALECELNDIKYGGT